MNKQMITFSFRMTPEAVRDLKKHARKRNKSCGAVLREMIEQISAKEETHESKNHRTNDCPGNGIDLGGGL